MKKRKKKSKAIKDLFLDRPTSHGGWPDGHKGSYTDPDTPVYKQIADYLKSMGLVDDDNPRARLAEALGQDDDYLQKIIDMIDTPLSADEGRDDDLSNAILGIELFGSLFNKDNRLTTNQARKFCTAIIRRYMASNLYRRDIEETMDEYDPIWDPYHNDLYDQAKSAWDNYHRQMMSYHNSVLDIFGVYTDDMGFRIDRNPQLTELNDFVKRLAERGYVESKRMRLTENSVRQLIREVIEEARSKLNVLHPMYSPKFLGDPELVKKIDVLDDEDPDYADEFYHTLGVEKGTLQNPHRVNDPAMLSGISADNLDAYVYDAVNEVIESTFCHWISKRDGWEYALDEYHPQNPKSQIFDLIDEIVEYAIDLSLQDFPGNKELRKAHVLQHGQDPDHYARLKPSNILDDIDEYFKNKQGWC